MYTMSNTVLTSEQALDRRLVMNNRNVVLRANYGSGKTTVVMKIVNDVKSSGGRAICLVYNSSMKHEMREKASSDCRQTIPHSAAQYIYDGVCGSNDDGISTSLTAAVSTKGFDLVARTTHIIVDEAQDITPLFYEFISVPQTRSNPQWNRSIIIVGRGRNARSESMERFGY
jgi:superfamily II DNA or RNA helicase